MQAAIVATPFRLSCQQELPVLVESINLDWRRWKRRNDGDWYDKNGHLFRCFCLSRFVTLIHSCFDFHFPEETLYHYFGCCCLSSALNLRSSRLFRESKWIIAPLRRQFTENCVRDLQSHSLLLHKILTRIIIYSVNLLSRLPWIAWQ